MAIVITNGTYYIRYDLNTGATKKTTDINLAYRFATAKDAIDGMKQARGKTKKFYVYDTNSQYVIWRWMTEEECQTAHCGRHKPHFDFGDFASPIAQSCR